MFKSFRVKLKPTAEQVAQLNKNWDGYRLAYNFAVEQAIRYYDNVTIRNYETGEKTYPFQSGFDLTKKWTQYKKTVEFDIYGVSSRTTEGAVHDVQSACDSFFDHVKKIKENLEAQKKNKSEDSKDKNPYVRDVEVSPNYGSVDIVDGEEQYVKYLFKLDDGTPVYSLYYRTCAPQFKHKSSRISFPTEYQGLTVTADGVFIPGITGRSRTKVNNFFEFARKGYIPSGSHNDENGSHYINPRISFDGVDWWFSVGTEAPNIKCKLNKGLTIGIDLGVKTLATQDDGTKYARISEFPNYRKAYERQQILKAALDRKRHHIKQLGTENGLQSNSYKKLKRRYLKAKNRVNDIKNEYLHKVSFQIVNQLPEVIGLEDLSVVSMLQDDEPKQPKNSTRIITKNEIRKGHRSISEASMSSLKNKIVYKSQWRGIDIQEADRWDPTSQVCNVCGYRKHNLTLKHRRWTCPECGTTHDRDVNAAKNIHDIAVEQHKHPKPVKVKKSRPRIRKKVAQ